MSAGEKPPTRFPSHREKVVNMAAAYLRSRIPDILHVLAADPHLGPALATTQVIAELQTDDVDEGRIVHAPAIRLQLADGESGEDATVSPETAARLARIARGAPRMGVDRDGFVQRPNKVGIMAREVPGSATARALDKATLSSQEHLAAARATCARIDLE